MGTWKNAMDILAGITFFVAFLPYIYAIVTGSAQPSPITWTIWACVDTLALFAMIKENAKTGQLMGATIGAWIIVLLAIVYGVPTMNALDWFSITGAVTGIILWQRTGNAVMAIICAQISVFVGALPTFGKAYENPLTEDALAWIVWLISCMFALLAIKKWNLANSLQPITFTIIEITMVFLIVVKPLF